MIKGIGVDVIEIERFDGWNTNSIERLQRIFTLEEIEYSLHEPTMSAARFAARFAAKEAAYKALSNALEQPLPPFATVAPLISVHQPKNAPPELKIDWTALPLLNNRLTTHLSLSHADIIACAFVVIEDA